MSRLPVGYSVRLAIVTKVFATQVECSYIDREGERKIMCPMPYPYAGSGGGVFFGIEKNTRVLVALAPQEQPYIVGVVPDRNYYFSQNGVKDSLVTSSSYPQLLPGEICIKGPTGSRIDLLKNGNLAFEASTGEHGADLEFSKLAKGLFTRTNNIYKFTEAGREIEGIIRRDKNNAEDPNDTKSLDFLSGEAYENLLLDVGRKPTEITSFRTTQISKFAARNPALIEKRSIVYEYAYSYGVRGLPYESQAMLHSRNQKTAKDNLGDLSIDYSARENRRTDILDLNLRNYNHLIEKVEGTVVDIYGNILDLNRNKIDVSTLKINTSQNNGAAKDLQQLYSYLRRSIKYHFEINSRKDTQTIDFPIRKDLVSNNAKEHSRWSFDVDGEGLTKINIPASSETGNLPILGRYVVSRNTEANAIGSGQFKDTEHIDIRMLPFGKGIAVTSTENIKPIAPVVADSSYQLCLGTAHHNLMEIAPSIFKNGGKLRNPTPAVGADTKAPMTSVINNKIIIGNETNPQANAGGRSLQANLDGSIEISIGADTADRKSLVMDLAGGVISHYGRDRNGRSIIHQTDGDVIIQIGGPGLKEDGPDNKKRFTSALDTEDRPGRVEIHLNRPGGKSQKIIIDENGITLDIYGSGLIQTSGDLSLKAKGTLLLDAESIVMYGKVNTDIDGDRSISGSEKLVVRDGRIV